MTLPMASEVGVMEHVWLLPYADGKLGERMQFVAAGSTVHRPEVTVKYCALVKPTIMARKMVRASRGTDPKRPAEPRRAESRHDREAARAHIRRAEHDGRHTLPSHEGSTVARSFFFKTFYR